MKSPNRHFAAVGLAFAVVIVWLLATLPAPAQVSTNAPSPYVPTNTTVTVTPGSVGNAAEALGLGTGTASFLDFLGTAAVDDYPYFTNGVLKIDAGALKNGSHWGGYIGAFVPFATNNWQLSYGIVGGYINHQFGVANVSANIGKTFAIPVLSKYIGSFYADVTAGPDYNTTTKSIGAIALGGVTWGHAFDWGGKTYMFGANYSYGTITGVNGNIQGFGAYFTLPFR